MHRFPARYALFADYVAPARAKSELWRTLLGLVMALVLGFVVVQLLIAGLSLALGPMQARFALLEVAKGASPLGVIILLFAYLPMLLGIGLVMVLLMGRGLGGLIGPWRPALGNLIWVALPLSALSIVLLPLSTSGTNISANLALSRQLPWLPLALIGLLVQTATEEVLFRGYLQQHLAARFASPLIWMLLPSLGFGLMHYSDQQFGADAWLVVAWATLFGLAAADLTARTGNLGAAIGLHLANNMSAVLLLGMVGNLDGLALYTVSSGEDGALSTSLEAVVETVALLVNWLLARLILRV